MVDPQRRPLRRPGNADARRRASSAVMVGSMSDWKDGDIIPEVRSGQSKEFIVAVRRAHNGKVYSFAADYLNACRLRYEYGCPKESEGCRGDDCEDGCPTTGWFSPTGDEDDGRTYHALSLRDGDKLVGWRDVPQWSDDHPGD